MDRVPYHSELEVVGFNEDGEGAAADGDGPTCRPGPATEASSALVYGAGETQRWFRAPQLAYPSLTNFLSPL